MWKRGNDDAAKSRQVKEWARETLALPADATVMVSELACSEPGCPPLETVIAVLLGPGVRRQFKIHRGLAELTRADVAALKEGDDHDHD